MLKSVGKIRRLHGLDGAVVVAIFADSYIDTYEIFNNLKQGDYVFLDGQKLQIERIFGFTKNICRIKFVGYDMSDAKNLCGEYLQVEFNGFDYDQLIGLPIYINDRIYARISAIYNFGGGIVCDTNKDMVAVSELDLSHLDSGKIYYK